MNSYFIVKVRTIKIVPYDIFSLNIHVLFRLNNIASMLFGMNNIWIFRLNMSCDAFSMVLTFIMKDEFIFEPDPIYIWCELYEPKLTNQGISSIFNIIKIKKDGYGWLWFLICTPLINKLDACDEVHKFTPFIWFTNEDLSLSIYIYI